MDLLKGVLGQKVGNTRVVPLITKIVVIFVIFLLLSNLASNYINLTLNRGELIKLMNQLLVRDLKEVYTFAGNQYDIYVYNEDYDGAVESLRQKALSELKNEFSLALGLHPDGSVFYLASKDESFSFDDNEALSLMNTNAENQVYEGSFHFRYNQQEYFGIYKYNPNWDVYLIRGEEIKEFYAGTTRIFINISMLIVGITLLCAVVGFFCLKFILRYVEKITQSLMHMQESSKLSEIDLSNAPNDNVTYLGVSFNSLSSTINNLMSIFRKFVSRDIAVKAYEEKQVRLEGTRKDLAILFSDIKGFTNMTEILGTDVIRLLNIHYDRAIRYIHKSDGIVGSIIGDAILAVFGVDRNDKNKSYQSLTAAYDIQDVASQLRKEIEDRKEFLIKQKGGLTNLSKKIYEAVLIRVGVGIDGGEVFYGNIGSNERMTNTVIGDNVNSSSRLEGLTRIYNVPVICSDYVKDEVTADYSDYYFLELDTVKVKGKDIGKKIYWPVQEKLIDEKFDKELKTFSAGLALYYEGQWGEARKHFSSVNLPLVNVFNERISSTECPSDWSGIWQMKTK